MLQVEETMANVVEDILVSYEIQISALGALVNNTHGIMQESKTSLARLSSQLREVLADSASLRKKDYDRMMAILESQQDDRYREIKGLLDDFILVHREAAHRLKDLLSDARSGGTANFREALDGIQARQNSAQNKVISRLRATQNEQEELMTNVRKLLNGSRAVRAKEFKTTLRELTSREKIAIT